MTVEGRERLAAAPDLDRRERVTTNLGIDQRSQSWLDLDDNPSAIRIKDR